MSVSCFQNVPCDTVVGYSLTGQNFTGTEIRVILIGDSMYSRSGYGFNWYSEQFNDDPDAKPEYIGNQNSTLSLVSNEIIHPLNQPDFCIFKRYEDYGVNHQLWLWPCDKNHTHKKYNWEFDESTGLIKSLGSEIKYPEQPYCWYLSDPELIWKQRVKIKPCDQNDNLQKFEFFDGVIYPTANTNLCVGYELSGFSLEKRAVTVQKCMGNEWGSINDIHSESIPLGQFRELNYSTKNKKLVAMDQTIRPFCFENNDSCQKTNCVYKRYLSYTKDQTVWTWPCEASHFNSVIAAKYQWRYDSASGLITSIGSEIKNVENPFCWKFSRNSTWKQRVKIDRCDAKDDFQKFDYAEGKLFSRSFPNLCVGYDLQEYGERDGKVALTLMSCFGMVWGSFE